MPFRLALLASTLAAVAVANALPSPTSLLAGRETVDAHGSWWFHWWVAQAVSEGASLGHTSLLFFPWGKDVLAHTGGNVLDALLVLPVRRALGPEAAWNLLAFGALATNGLAAGWWARRAGDSAAVAAVAIATLNPFPLHELALGRPTQAILAPLLVALALGDRALRELRWRDAALAGAALALQGWIYWYAAGFGAVALCVLAVGRPFGPRLARLAAMGALSMALTAPVVVPMLSALRTGDVPGLLPVQTWLAGEPAWRNAQGTEVQLGALGPWGVAGFVGSRRFVAEGFTLGALGLAAAAFAPARWIAVAVLGLVLSVGPFPGDVPNPAYLALTAVAPPMERLYWPVRWLALVMAAGIVGIGPAFARAPERWRGWLAGGVVALAIAEPAARGVLPVGAWRPTVHPAFACLAEAEGAVIVLPWGLDQVPLVAQTVHHRPMLNGMHERSTSLVPAEAIAFRRENAWMDALLTSTTDPRAVIPWTEEDEAQARALGYRFVVVRLDRFAEPNNRAGTSHLRRGALSRLRALAGPPVYQDDTLGIWAPWGGWPAGCVPSTDRQLSEPPSPKAGR
ncbi:MAG: hypothetical protein ACOZNI_15320 [Myxococcota bacterium]